MPGDPLADHRAPISGAPPWRVWPSWPAAAAASVAVPSRPRLSELLRAHGEAVAHAARAGRDEQRFGRRPPRPRSPCRAHREAGPRCPRRRAPRSCRAYDRRPGPRVAAVAAAVAAAPVAVAAAPPADPPSPNRTARSDQTRSLRARQCLFRTRKGLAPRPGRALSARQARTPSPRAACVRCHG